MVDYMAMGRRIRAARKALNLTQEEASERCDITSSYYGNLERGDKKMSVETLVKLSEGLGVSADSLLYGDSPHEQKLLSDVMTRVKLNADPEQFEKYLTIMEAVSGIVDKL